MMSKFFYFRFISFYYMQIIITFFHICKCVTSSVILTYQIQLLLKMKKYSNVY